ncbi:MAG TPA: phytoene/squalene synthase family protein [Tepidisphaeraceae bacterium]|nr:phytoene/squalene synthase family protein [Tepidisphaeraceae bacterium]
MRPSAKASNSASEVGAFAAARDICRRHARSFYFISAFLPKPKRDAACAVLAFCRMIDEAIDQPPGMDAPNPAGSPCCSTDELTTRLKMFEQRLGEIYDNRLELPNTEFRTKQQHTLRAISLTVNRYEIPKEHFMDLAEGCRMDLVQARYPTWDSLERYCHHVAGSVGLMMSCVFGLTHSDAQKYAVMMGNAMQLTNILRDMKQDWDRGRIYLPLEDMARFRYSEKQLATGVINTAFRELMQFEINRARQMYQQASEGLCWLAGDGSRLTASATAVLHAGILDAIQKQHYDVFNQIPQLTTSQKFRRLPAAWQLARRQPDEPLPRIFI